MMQGAAAPDAGEGQGGIAFVTVTFRDELELLRLQARSMAAFLPDALVAEILVIVNDRDEAGVGAAVEAMRPDYGVHAGKLRVVGATDLFRWDAGPGGAASLLRRIQALHPRLAFRSPGLAWRGHGGWKIQQACKLLAFRAVRAEWTVLLDSKIHFLAPVARSEFVTPDGRGRIICSDRERANQAWLASSFRRMGLEPSAAGPRVVNGIMPFPVRTRLLREVTETVEADVGPLQVYFAVHRKDETEVMLINAYCCARRGGLEAEFDTTRPLPPVIMRSTPAEVVEASVRRVEAGETTLALHRAAVARLSEDQRARLAALWRRAGLVRTEAELARLFSVRDSEAAA